MRISTSQIYDAGTIGIQRGQSSLYKLQNQLSSGRKILTPQDDPVAAAQALVVTQSMAVNQQYIDNQGQAKSQLSLIDGKMTSLVDSLQTVRDRIVQAGNTTLSQSDRASIATEIESRMGEILGIANSDNGVGEHLFSGYSGNVLPFAIDGSQNPPVGSPSTTSPVAYFGDDGNRLLQVSSSRQMAISVSGSDLFQNIKNGNGTFVTGTGGNGAGINLGTGKIDPGSVLDQQKWLGAVDSLGGQSLKIQFVSGGITGTQYQIVDPASGTTTAPQDYTSGQAITLDDFGVQVVVSGQPKDGDTFLVTPSTKQNVFQTMQNLVSILRTGFVPPTSTYTSTQFTNDLRAELTNIDQALDNVSRVQSEIGTKLQEIDSLGSAATDANVQYKANLSDLQDVDYAKAMSDFTQQKTNLDVAQKSFALISGLSLFTYL
jgi:flagellar hook-associated protein 3 FlgL